MRSVVGPQAKRKKTDQVICCHNLNFNISSQIIWVSKNLGDVHIFIILSYFHLSFGVPSGKRLQFAIENGPVEIVDLPIKNGNFPSLSHQKW